MPMGSLVVKGPAIYCGRRQPHRDLAAGKVAQLVGGVVDAVNGACHLDDGIRQGLAALARDLQGEVIALGIDQSGETVQDRHALMRLEPAVTVAEDALRGLKLGFEGRGVTRRDLGDRRAIKGLYDLQHGGGS